MKKDIVIPKVEDLAVVIAPEMNKIGGQEWFAYLVNLGDHRLDNILVSSRGYGVDHTTGQNFKTSSLSHFRDFIDPKSFLKIEPIMEEVFGLSNEYWVSFYKDELIYDKKYIFMAESIKEENFVSVPVLNLKGVMIQ